MIEKVTALAIAMIISAAPAGARPSSNPIPNFGKIASLPNAAMQPDPQVDYRVAFNITKSAARPGQVNPSLEKVARYMNLLAAGGVRPRKGNVLAVVHGLATDVVLTENAFHRRHGVSNPNIPLIEALEKAGIEVHVCGQALAGRQIAQTDVVAGVIVDLSALVTLTTLQQRGWSVIAD